MKLILTIPAPYDFASSVRDHGWIALSPFRWIDADKTVQRVEKLSSGRVVLLHLSAAKKGKHVQLTIDVDDALPMILTADEQQEIITRVRWMLRLDEDFSEFYALCAEHPEMVKHVSAKGRGRLLRSSTLYEDVIKTILTTNTTWSQTKAMAARLVSAIGESYNGDDRLKAFPSAEQIVAAGEKVFETDVRLGYRNGYVLQLAREVAEGTRNIEALRTSTLPIKELKRELKQIKGVGDYAAHTLLMLLGRYDEVAVDTELRAHVRRKHPNGHELSDKEMAALYDSWGAWKYLAYWFDMIDGPVT
jgi:3-methyladenine DNA glycosylase/8-oxoguanine DNA glycosylase